MHLLKAVSSANVHIAPWRRKGILFEEAHASFLRTAPRIVLGEKDSPSQKRFEDRLKVILCKRREYLKRTAEISGIVSSLVAPGARKLAPLPGPLTSRSARSTTASFIRHLGTLREWGVGT